MGFEALQRPAGLGRSSPVRGGSAGAAGPGPRAARRGPAPRGPGRAWSRRRPPDRARHRDGPVVHAPARPGARSRPRIRSGPNCRCAGTGRGGASGGRRSAATVRTRRPGAWPRRAGRAPGPGCSAGRAPVRRGGRRRWSPSWPSCFDLFSAHGAQTVGVPLDEEGMRPELLAAALSEHEPDLLFVMPSFHNPTGRLTSAPRRRRIAELAQQHDVTVVEDLAHSGRIDTRGELPPPMGAFAPRGCEVLTIGSLSKPVWGGLRVGWLRAEEPVAARFARHKALADLGTPSSTRPSPHGCCHASPNSNRHRPSPPTVGCAT
ncbi:aminotransferase class I/II-fold pyridoxal phosphate-dependent enzyme [Streptomyces sp. NPDC049949]|uniref:aminotransferase class I/II-fold pyridoxal phosphate-dependent enzyme n=1 Tax=Streptomyces sp. NPDC049949 TaxID=3154627 RepID=UPI003447E7DA